MDSASPYVPYCGLPPGPAELWMRWNLDPWLIALLICALAVHGVRIGAFSMSKSPAQRPRPSLFYAAWGAFALAFISPLCALGVALFAARVSQHAWVTMIAAPLLVLASPPHVVARARPLIWTAVFAAFLWMWHAPALYDLTFRSDIAYWLMHVTLAVAAVRLWRGLIHGGAHEWVARLGAGFITVAQMGLLGALITLAPRTLYQAHVLTTERWGLTPLEDQQLGGLIMWAPTGVVLMVASLMILYDVLRQSPAAGPQT